MTPFGSRRADTSQGITTSYLCGTAQPVRERLFDALVLSAIGDCPKYRLMALIKLVGSEAGR
jgi:hypothetical protein